MGLIGKQMGNWKKMENGKLEQIKKPKKLKKAKKGKKLISAALRKNTHFWWSKQPIVGYPYQTEKLMVDVMVDPSPGFSAQHVVHTQMDAYAE